MAGLASQPVAGFVPTPPRVVAALGHQLTVATAGAKRVVRVLDPCAGNGEPAATLARALDVESYGIELNEERAEQCRARLDHLLTTSAFSVRLTNGAFSLLWLIPPDDADDEKRRLEHAFLTSLSRVLCPGRVLAFLIPQPRLAVSARYLAAHYTAFRAYRFPAPEFAAFQQIALLATMKPQPTSDPQAQARLEAWSDANLPPLPDAPDGPRVVVPALLRTDILFAPLAFDPHLAVRKARRRGVWAQQPAFTEQLWPPTSFRCGR
ncbi:MAG: DUF6094 domain-containing protein [Dehalococcoidia bacterium]